MSGLEKVLLTIMFVSLFIELMFSYQEVRHLKAELNMHNIPFNSMLDMNALLYCDALKTHLENGAIK